MRACEVYVKGIFAGVLTEKDDGGYVFVYDHFYFNDRTLPPVSLTLPKCVDRYESDVLFPCFFNILSEGENRKMQSRLFHIDERDDFGILLETAQYDTIGSITVKPLTR